MAVISGMVYDSDSLPIAGRSVRAYRRDTGDLLGVAVSEDGSSVPDPDYAKVVLLLNMDGANGSTTFIDSSSAPRALTALGAARMSTAQSKWGGASGYFDGAASYLSTPGFSDLDFGTQDFCIELFVRFTALSASQALVTNRSATGLDHGFYLRLNAGVIQALCWGPTGGTQFATINGTTSILTNQWYHVAYCRSGSTFRLFLNGQLEGSTTTSDAISFALANPLIVGNDPTVAGRSLNGHMDDLRITKGAARYTANFTPPTKAFPSYSTTPPLGAYRIPTGTFTGEAQVLCLDDAAGTLENDLILRTLPV